MSKGFDTYLRRDEFGTLNCGECGPMTEEQIQHVLTDLSHWLWEHKGQPVPETIYAITKWLEGK